MMIRIAAFIPVLFLACSSQESGSGAVAAMSAAPANAGPVPVPGQAPPSVAPTPDGVVAPGQPAPAAPGQPATTPQAPGAPPQMPAPQTPTSPPVAVPEPPRPVLTAPVDTSAVAPPEAPQMAQFRLGDTFEGEAFDTALSSGVEVEDGTHVGFFDAGDAICYPGIDFTGVQSVEFQIARFLATAGRFAVLIGGSDPEADVNVGERETPNTGGWTTFVPLTLGLARPVEGVQTMCLYGVQGGGIGNVNTITLSAQPADNDGITDFSTPPPADPPPVPAITTMGNQVLFGGQPGSVAGMSFFWSSIGFGGDAFYNASMVQYLAQDWNAKIVRAAVGAEDQIDDVGMVAGAGYISQPFLNRTNMSRVANAAIENGMYIIIDWHTHDAEEHVDEAIKFFKEAATKYGQFPNVIYEIYNEPDSTDWAGVKAYAERVIPEIRAIDPDNLIIVGTPTWSQDVDQAAVNPLDDPNVAYALHFYAATHRDNLRQKAQQALAGGIPLFVTEWGTVAATGDGQADRAETMLWMQFLKENNISHVNWSVSAQEGSSIGVMGASPLGGWDDGDLSESGQFVRGIIQSW